ncbi:sodium/glutamate symporter [Bordetella sp. 02P26C-1]|uniref:sodium/glutamate symporter n=1 Tax=Bordetella sp. 02P26C-1 TaxID=2683195 RepID=UPI001354EE2B|nr:sodium/glutamate symporter [Bordetella sp. 02P26C-1]MVW80726.1 sodium/glutamate symporter [Bordetella sp. 02P26C-1]
MLFEFDAMSTLVIAIVVLLIGRALVNRIGFLRRYSIPEPVVGGLLAAVLITVLLFGADVQVAMDLSLQTPLMLAFFATIGLGADLRTLLKGGRSLIVFWALMIGMLVVQNIAGITAAWAMDLHPLVGLLSGSITLLGGHGTGAAYAGRFAEVDNLQGAMELAMACATFGLVLGGVLGGPVAQRLIKRNKLSKETAVAPGVPAAAAEAAEVQPDETASGAKTLTPISFMHSLLLIVACVLCGRWLSNVAQNEYVTLPSFVWTLFTGVVLRNGLSFARLYKVDDNTVALLGGVSLSLFLAMALLALRLWELVSLALPILVVLAIQTVLAAIYITYLTFPVMGRNYDAAVISAGHCGLALGATPTAIANMQAITAKYGPSPQAFLIIPIVGAFLIDITNALFLQGFLTLPIFGY